jgi:hypothetical protein
MVEARTAALIQQSLHYGKNIPQAVMDVAKAYGWQVQVPAPTNGDKASTSAEPTPQEKIALSRAKTAASMGSVGNIPSGPTKARSRITAEEFKHMTEAEMEKREKEDPSWMDNLDL